MLVDHRDSPQPWTLYLLTERNFLDEATDWRGGHSAGGGCGIRQLYSARIQSIGIKLFLLLSVAQPTYLGQPNSEQTRTSM